jgi:hypothetical protein
MTPPVFARSPAVGRLTKREPRTPNPKRSATLPDALLSPDVLAKLEHARLRQPQAVARARPRRAAQHAEGALASSLPTIATTYKGTISASSIGTSSARLDRLFVKLFLEEEDLHFYALVDSQPVDGLRRTDQVADGPTDRCGARLHRLDPFASRLHRDARAEPEASRAPIWRGRHNAWRMFEHISGRRAHRTCTSLLEGVKQFRLASSGRGILVLVTDLMDKSGYEEALRYLSARRFDTYVVHILSKEELQPDVAGELRLIDCEDEHAIEVTVGEPLVKAYDRTLKAFLREAEEFCTRRGLHYTFVDNQAPIEKTIADTLRRRDSSDDEPH